MQISNLVKGIHTELIFEREREKEKKNKTVRCQLERINKKLAATKLPMAGRRPAVNFIKNHSQPIWMVPLLHGIQPLLPHYCHLNKIVRVREIFYCFRTKKKINLNFFFANKYNFLDLQGES